MKHIVIGFIWLVTSCVVCADPMSSIPNLPMPISNNAVAALNGASNQTWILSATGLKSGKTYKDVSKSVYLLKVGDDQWQQLEDLPIVSGVLAGTAEAVNGKFYIIGGYTVAADGSEKSSPHVISLDPVTKKYESLAVMPVPVDDSVSFVYLDRYIYFVSGWHDGGNVNHTQVYDTQTNEWAIATAYPGTAVFGHAGGIVGRNFVIADGVAVLGVSASGRRQYGAINEAWQGSINAGDHLMISWKRLPQLAGKGHYRMAATGDARTGLILFSGGSDNAYNYSGIGYDGIPSEPASRSLAWDIKLQRWTILPDKQEASMDHRGLVFIKGHWSTIGGMLHKQLVTNRVLFK